jgi:hypothetical protein
VCFSHLLHSFRVFFRYLVWSETTTHSGPPQRHQLLRSSQRPHHPSAAVRKITYSHSRVTYSRIGPLRATETYSRIGLLGAKETYSRIGLLGAKETYSRMELPITCLAASLVVPNDGLPPPPRLSLAFSDTSSVGAEPSFAGAEPSAPHPPSERSVKRTNLLIDRFIAKVVEGGEGGILGAFNKLNHTKITVKTTL